jgi:REP element-mobilizing transposase RayT
MGGAKRYPSSRLCEHARMTGYRRNFVAGGSFFFTVNLAERRLRLLTGHVDLLRTAFREVRRRHPFTIDAMVVLPDHLHTLWTMPEGDADFAMRWQFIKSALSRRLPVGERISDSRAAQGRTGHLAAALLGAYHSRRERFRASHRLHPYQPRQTRARNASPGLAVFLIPPYGETRHLPGGLGRRCCGRRRTFWRADLNAGHAMGIASLHPSYGLR